MMKQIAKMLCLGLVAASAAFAQQPANGPATEPELKNLDAANVNTPATNLITAGQPSAEDLTALKAMGVTKVINLRTDDEPAPFDEEALVKSLGMEYAQLPIAGGSDVTKENAAKLDALLDENEKTFLHCASSNRVGALMALRAYENEGLPADQALAEGKSAGLGSLAKRVTEILATEEPCTTC